MAAGQILLNSLGALLGVVIGWLLKEISDAIKLGREDRRAAGKVLVELLELRRSLHAIPVVISELRRILPQIPPEAEPAIRALFQPIVLKMIEGLPERYDKAVDSIAGRLPLLAFDLRSKNRITPYLEQFRTIVLATDAKAAALFPFIEGKLHAAFLPELDELILTLARLHSWRTWFKIRQDLKSKDELGEEQRKIVDSIVESLQAAVGNTGTQGGGV